VLVVVSSVSVFQLFSVSVLQCFSASVLQCFSEKDSMIAKCESSKNKQKVEKNGQAEGCHGKCKG
jgi:hypothetical protein